MNFTKAEKLAIVCVLVGMMNVDSDVDFREVALMESLITEFNLSRAEAAQGRDLNLLVALATIRDFSQPKKLFVADLLVKMIEADGKLHPLEERFLTVIQSACQLLPL
ncbi:MAG: TerB family tellurite resistance protein [Duncaniella sp.]|nr:TerB family tellurite resistance protein [Duncaniella sp.]